MDRRAFLTGAAALLVAPLVAAAQQAGKVWRVGFVSPAFGLSAPFLAFRRGLRDNGLVEGQNVEIDERAGIGALGIAR